MARLLPIFILMMVAGSCRFSKGDIYYLSSPDDSLSYVITAKGNGEKLSQKASGLKILHESKGNECTIRYLSDSVSMKDKRSILLINTSLPEIKDDMLTKGFFGTFTSRQSVNFRLVTYEDFHRYFVAEKP